MYRAILFIICAFSLTGCRSQNPDEFTKYYEDGRAKPSIAIAPIIDTTTEEYSWSLADEFKSLILTRIAGKGTLFISDPHDNTTFIPSSENPFGTDISWVKKEYEPNEFVVFLELVEHETVPLHKAKNENFDASSNLNMAIRVRIIDIRGSQPKVVLQELIKDSYYITKTIIQTDYDTVNWGMDEYRFSPMSLAHSKIVKEVVERINDYILLAKSRWNG